MRRSDLAYELPEELIAQRPATPRDAARLMVVHRSRGRIEHRVFRDLVEYVGAGDCLVLNDTRVVAARFFCRRASGGRIEGLFLREEKGDWRVLLRPSARVRIGELLRFDAAPRCSAAPDADQSPDLSDRAPAMRCADPRGAPCSLRVVGRAERGTWCIRPEPAFAAMDVLERVGSTPLPPYIRAARRRDGKDEESEADSARYQTVYAEHAGSTAAPTAGLHFTPDLLARLSAQGVERVAVTLHVGLGTFEPIEVEDLADHRMHAEWYEAQGSAVRRIRQTKARGGRITAVGTTSCRVLETIARREDFEGQTGEGTIRDWTQLFLYPPAKFRLVDRLITNFHLPGSTLLALVMAFAGVELMREAYAKAIATKYRFYSYGDAMMIV